MRFRKDDVALGILMFASMLICVFCSSVPFFSWAALFLFAFFLFHLIHRFFSFSVKYFPLFFGVVSQVFGVALCEFSSLSLYEINESARFAGSLPLLIFTQFVFFQTLLLFDKPTEIKRKTTSVISLRNRYPLQCHIVSIVSSAVLFAMFIRIIKYPAFLMGYDRFQYANNVMRSSGIWSKFESISYALILFPLLDYFNGHKITGIIGTCCYVLFYLWNGNKFGPFYTVAVVYFLVEYKKFTTITRAKKKKYLIIGMGLVIALIALATILQTSVMNGSWSDYLGKRVAQQGQLWWKTYDSTTGYHLNEIKDEVFGALHGSSVVAENVDANYGIYKIMYYCGDPQYISYKLGVGSRFTEAGYASAYYYFGLVGCVIFAIINAMILSATVKAMIRALQKGRIIRILILMRLYTIERISYSMFIFMDYIDEISILSYIYLLFSMIRLPRLGGHREKKDEDERLDISSI